MRRLLKLIIIVLLAYVSYSAYVDSKTNGKSFWFNLGRQSKEVVSNSKQKTTEIVKDVGSGIKADN